MSEEELKKLKEDLKRELLNELTSKQVTKDNAWRTVKEEFEKMFYSKGYTKGTEQAKIFNAIATITRISLGYNQVQVIPAEKVDEIRQIMFKILNIFPKR